MYSISAYQVSITSASNKKLPLKTAVQVTSGKQTLFKTFFDGIAKTSQPIDFSADKKIAQFYMPVYDVSKDTLWGKIGTGEYGYATDIYDPSSKKITYQKTKNQAGMIPFYYFFKPSKDPNSGILVVQKFKQYGIKTFLNQKLISYLANIQQNSTLTIEKIVPNALLQKLLTQGEVRTLRLLKQEVSSDICDGLSAVDTAKQAEQIEIIIKAAKGGSFSGLALFNAFKNKKLSGLITIPDFSYDEIKVDIDIDGRKRVVSLGHPGRLAGNIDITSELEVGIDGHPLEDSLKNIMSDFADEILIQF